MADNEAGRDRQEGTRGAPIILPEDLLMWEKLAGDRLPELMESREGAARFLQDSDWRLRLCALSLLKRKWRPDAALAETSEKLAFADPHPQVRGVALHTLACCFQGTDDPRIGKLLADIVVDERRYDEQSRRSAYSGLFILRDIDVSERLRAIKKRFPEDVDWEFVASFRPTNA